MAIVISGVNNNDKITASDGTIDLLSGVNYAGIITAPAFTTPGNITAGHLNIGSGIQLGNAGVATATTFVGNLTGNVNATSNLLLQIGGSEKFRVGSSGQLGIGGANYGTSGQVLTSGGSGSAPTWSTIASDKITEGNTEAEVYDNGSDGRFTVKTEGSERFRITSDGKLGVGIDTPTEIFHIKKNDAGGPTITLENNANKAYINNWGSTGGGSGRTNRFEINATNQAQASYCAPYHTFMTGGVGDSNEKVRIDAGGNMNVTGIVTASTFNGIIVPATYPSGRRNMFINGEFAINQRGNRDPHANRNNGANNLGYGGPDHVQVVKNIGSYDAKQANENSSPRTQAGASYSYELDVTATGSTSNTGYCFLNWMWNGTEVNRLLYGTSSARPITVSFWCQSNLTGTFGINMRNYGTDRMISQALTINSANTWEYKTVTFVGDTASQFAVTINATMAIELWLAAGTDYNSGTPQSTWASRNDTRRSAGTNINIASNTSNYFRISLLQVEMGEFATPFEFRTYGEYLHDCEYYFQKPASSRGSTQALAIHIWGHKIADTYALRVQSMMRPTEMRTNPTDYFHDNNPSGLTAQRFQTQGSDYEYTYNVGMSIGSNYKEFSGGTKYPYEVNGITSAQSGILFAYDFESYAEY